MVEGAVVEGAVVEGAGVGTTVLAGATLVADGGLLLAVGSAFGDVVPVVGETDVDVLAAAGTGSPALGSSHPSPPTTINTASTATAGNQRRLRRRCRPTTSGILTRRTVAMSGACSAQRTESHERLVGHRRHSVTSRRRRPHWTG